MVRVSVPAGPRELLPLNSTGGMMWHPVWKENIHAVLKITGGSHGCPHLRVTSETKNYDIQVTTKPCSLPQEALDNNANYTKTAMKTTLCHDTVLTEEYRAPKQVTHSWKNPFWAWHETMPLKRVNKPPAEGRLGHLGQRWLSQCSSQLEIRE